MPSARTHVSGIGLSRKATNASIALLLALLALLFFFLYVALTAQAAEAQTAVPRTALEAARMPQFAAKLRAGQNASRGAQGYRLQSSYRNPLRSRQGGSLPTDDIVYTNGPINGTTDAWTINFGFVVSDTFTVPSGGANLTALSFGAWLFPGDVLQSVEVSITDSEFGGTTYFDGIVNFSQSDCIGNQYGFNVCTESGSFTLNNLAQGTYWVNLQNASVNTGDPVYWDENSGPSLASENSVGTIPSEAFTLLGGTTTCPWCAPPPECVHDKPQNGFRIAHAFTNDAPPATGLAIDQAGNVYGSTPGGSNGLGLAYEIGVRGMFTPLYNFTEGSQGQNPLPEAVGPEKALYGAADGGIANCGPSGTEYCGVVYRLRPSPAICLAALCSWNEAIIYRFTGDPDGWKPKGSPVFDQAGNLYGTTAKGGIYGRGTVYELTPSNGGWTEKVIYSFTPSDGDGPSSLLAGSNGDLYGTTFVSGHGGGIVFQLSPYGGGWTERIIAGFPPCTDYSGCSPILAQEKMGTFYGIYPYDVYLCPPGGCLWNQYARIFTITPSGQINIVDDTRYYWLGNWLDPGGYDLYYDVAIDASGNVYATEGGYTGSAGGDLFWGNIFKVLGLDEDRLLVGFGGTDFRDLKADPSGKLYGTTGDVYRCTGTVWQLTPP